MATASLLPAASELPAIRDEIVVGPDEYMRGRVMCFAKDRETGLYFRLGRREAVLLRGLQERIGFEALAARYQETIGRRLSYASLEGAIKVFAGAGLIAGTGDQAAGTGRDQTIIGAAPTLFSLKIIRWDPDLYLSGILPYWRWLAHPATFLAVALVVLVTEVLMLTDVGAIFSVANTIARHDLVARLLVLIAVNCVMFMLHEGAHALVCKAYGGEVHEMGFQIRYLTVTPYTRVDDALLFKNRWRRVAVFVAGPFASLLAVTLALVCWNMTTPGTLAHASAADMLIWYNTLCFLQFVPFVQLDGYLVLAQLLKMPDLRQDSFSYLYRRLLSMLGLKDRVRLSPEVAGYVGPVYLGYGILSFLVTTGLLVLIIVKQARRLTEWLGPAAGYAIVSVLVGLLLARFVWQVRKFNGHVAWN